MSNEVAVKQSTEMVIPQSLAALFAGKGNLVQTESTPSLTFKGKTWTVSVKGEHKQLLDADDNPLPSVEILVLGANQRRSRTYYEGTYTEGSNLAPTCSSYDSRHPAKDVEEPQSDSCETCPHAVKGSKVTESGVSTSACSIRQRLVVVPSDNANFTALLLNLPSTSIYDKEEADSAKGWFSWVGYAKQLQSRGIPHTGIVRTRVRFDPSVAYPKLQFRFNGFVDEEMASIVASRADSDEVLFLLNKDYKSEVKQIEVKPVAAKVTQAEPEETPAPTQKAEAKPEKPKAAKAKPAEAEAPKAKPVVVDDEDATMAALTSWDD